MTKLQGKNPYNARKIIKKLKIFFEVKTDLQLAEILGMEANTLSTWKSRNSLNFDVIFTCLNKSEKKIDYNWLFSDHPFDELEEKPENDMVKDGIMTYRPKDVREGDEIIIRIKVEGPNEY